LLFNRGEQPAEIGVEWEQLGYPGHLSARLRDLWKGQDLPAQKDRYSTMVEPYAVVLLTIRP
jgi:hypothetical protein